jgi:hypothetical protein
MAKETMFNHSDAEGMDEIRTSPTPSPSVAENMNKTLTMGLRNESSLSWFL